MGRIRSIQEAALAIVQRLRAHGYQALWAGGCVRDMLLGHVPSDIDVATDATPDQVCELFSRTRRVGAQFGVVLVRQGRVWIETATFRTDLSYRDGRRPEGVVFSTPEEDARRRDFTINGLFYDPIEQTVIDYVGGQSDLQARIIRAIGDPGRRFGEDHLRLLRAVRFATRLGFEIEPATTAAIRAHAADLDRISAERIREELEKMLGHPTRARAAELMVDLGLLAHLWPGAQDDLFSETSVNHLEDLCGAPDARLCTALERLRALPERADFVLAMAALLYTVAPAGIEQIGRALRCSNQQIGDLAWLVGREPQLHRVDELTLADFKRLLAHPRWADLLALHAAVLAASGADPGTYETALARAAEIPADQVAPSPLVTGDDLIALGLQPGPRFKEILDTLYDAQLNEAISDRAVALNRLRELAEADEPG